MTCFDIIGIKDETLFVIENLMCMLRHFKFFIAVDIAPILPIFTDIINVNTWYIDKIQ